MSTNIFSSSFQLTPLHESAYQLKIDFLNEQRAVVDGKEFTFIHDACPNEEKVYDVLTKNGKCHASILKKLFSNKDVDQAQQSALCLSTAPSPLLWVLDLQHPQSGYCKGEPIKKNEEEVCQFFKASATGSNASAPSKKLHGIFHQKLPMDFMLCEGSLKVDLLSKGGFTDQEAAYFHTKGGALDFCQTTEFFMNAFKLGHAAQAQAGSLSGHSFIYSLSEKSFQPSKASTVLYPPFYKQIYAVDGHFAKTLGPVFSVSGGLDPSTEITVLNVEMKQ